MTNDQIIYAIVLSPIILLTIDWYINVQWIEQTIKYYKWIWLIMTISWVILYRDWNIIFIIVWLGFSMFLQPTLKNLYKK